MREPIKVLIVEHAASCSALQRRLLKEGVQFHWERVGSEAELRSLARDFDPGLVMGADAPRTPDVELDMLKLTARQLGEVLICEVHDGVTPPWRSSANHRPSVPASPSQLRWPQRPIAALPGLFEKSADAVAITDSEGWVTFANLTACRLLAAACKQPLGTHLAIGSAQRSQDYFDASWAPNVVKLMSGDVRQSHGMVAFDAIKRRAVRVHLEDIIRCLAALAVDDRRALPLIGLNLNGLQLLNDSHGTEIANEVLSVISSAVQPRYARCGMFARVGEDEYLVALPHLSHAADAAVAAQGGRDMSSDFALHEDMRWVERPAPPLLAARKVPVAQNPFRQVTEILPDTQVESQLTDAIQRHSIGVHFQPQYETETGRGCGMEALARWTLSNGQTLLPGIFIPVAERLGMIGALGASVLENTCATAAQWRGKDAERMTISVNVATKQIGPEFSRMLTNVLRGSGMPASRLELEIEESALVSEQGWVFDWLRTWQQSGIRIAVNHAGLNYTALKYLSRVHVDRLKLDQSLVRRMTEDQKVSRAVHAVIALGEQLEVDVLAEGVETTAQLQLLRELGCRHVQGFLLARPMPAVQAQLALRKAWGNLPRSAMPREALAN